jgi:ribosomal small subunit protein bTHX
MGKGDIKTKRGKFFAGSFGKKRRKKKNRVSAPVIKATPVAAAKPKAEKAIKIAEPATPEVVSTPEKEQVKEKATKAKAAPAKPKATKSKPKEAKE